MAFWFKRKKQHRELREVVLPGNVGTVCLPSDFTVELENDSTLLAYPQGEQSINLRLSTLSIVKRPGDDQQTMKSFVQGRAQEQGHHYREVVGRGVSYYESRSEQDGVPLVIKYWELGEENTLVILTATTAVQKTADSIVVQTLDDIPRILESIKLTKSFCVLETEDRKIEFSETVAEPTEQTVSPFGPREEAWLATNLEQAQKLSVKYGSGGLTGTEELDVVFSRWTQDDEEKDSGDSVANALGAAFGQYLVENHAFRWVVVADKDGTEFAIRHNVGDITSFPRASVQNRIDDQESNFFHSIYLILLDMLEQRKSHGTK